jgi:hypothetical protein
MESIEAVELLSWREIDFAGVVLAGLIAGYVMALAGLWAGRVPGLTAIDIADFGRRYMVSDRPSAWLFGMVSHLINSVLLTLLFACAVAPNLHWAGWQEGMAWGAALAVLLAGALVAPMAGLGVLGVRAGQLRFPLTNLLIHIGWGFLVGVIYSPP